MERIEGIINGTNTNSNKSRHAFETLHTQLNRKIIGLAIKQIKFFVNKTKAKQFGF